MLTHTTASALETADELPSFVPENELRAALTAAQSIARQRDELASENARLRREVDDVSRAGGDGVSRRIHLLREALARKDQEILTLKSYQVGRDRHLQEAREKAEQWKRERAELEERLKSREGVFHAIEQERSRLNHALDQARRDGEQTTAALVHADSIVAEWRAALENAQRERDEARRQVAELRAAWQSLTTERQRLVDVHSHELATVRAEALALQEARRREHEAALAEATSRYESARAAHAITLRAAEDEHANELAAEREAREKAEGALGRADEKITRHEEAIEAWRARLAAAESERDEAVREAQVCRARIEAADEALEEAVREVHAVYGRELEAIKKAHEAEKSGVHELHTTELDATRRSHEAELKSLEGTYDAELRALRALVDGVRARRGGDEGERAGGVKLTDELHRVSVELARAEARVSALTAEVEALRDERVRYHAEVSEQVKLKEDAECRLVEVLAAKDAQIASSAREIRDEQEARLREAREGFRRELDDIRAKYEVVLDEQRAALESERFTLQDAHAGGTQRVLDLERDLDATREALGEYATEAAARIAAAERTAAEGQRFRDRYAQKLATAMRQLKDVTERSAREQDAMVGELRALTELVGRLTTRMVVQTAWAAASEAGRHAPEARDIEDAITLVAGDMPEALVSQLRESREAFLSRCHAMTN